jgi:hypothetical protein
MLQKLHKLLLTILKNFLAFVAGGLLGATVTLLSAKQLLESTIHNDIGLGIIAVAPVVILIYLIIFGTAGGILGIIVYNLIRRKTKKPADKK